jgi:predicted enzyme related to lactoylglutathione lyase
MTTFDSYKPGQPSWVDLSTSDAATSKRFYTGLFGWEVQEQGPEAGGYALFTLGGKNVAGVGPIMMEGQPTAWTTYVNVADAAASVAKVKSAGGTVFVEPMDVLDVGTMSVFADPTGAALALWQPKAHHGADIANEPGSFCWNELQTRDTDAAATFYEAVFGWTASAADMGGMTYTEWKLGDATIGGMMPMPAEVPEQVPAYWLTYFAVEDCDATVEKAGGLGATTLVPPMDIEPGRFAVVTDPVGAAFGFIALKSPA